MKLGTKIVSLGLLLLSGVGFAVAGKTGDNKAQEAEAAVDITDYSACNTAHNNGNASSLLTALRNITSPGSAGSYSALWSTYSSAFLKDDGYIKDYYSSKSRFTTANKDVGSDGSEGDYYNREHAIPKSWWGGATTNQGADPFIVFPTDKVVNGKRSSYTFGMVASASYSSYGSYSKLGNGSSSWGYTGTVFEPNDEVKGDLARAYFYAIAKYTGSYGWTSGDGARCFTGDSSTNFGLTAYAVKLFTYWHNLDKPDEWERTVNSRIADIQGNRNPFIDHPEYVNTLWGGVSGATQYSDSQVGITSISKTSTSITVGGTDTVSAVSSNSGNISWSSNNTSVATVSPATTSSGNSTTITAVAAGTATITASITISGNTYKKTCTVTVTASGGGGSGNTTYERLTSIANIDGSASYVLGVDGTGFHYSGTSSWGLVALPSAQTPLSYALTKGAGNTTFTARTTINSTTYYLTVPDGNSNTFTMSTSSSSITLGTTVTDANGDVNYAVANASNTDRHLRINGSNGLRAYTGTTGVMAYFYKVVTSSGSSPTLSSISVSGQTASFTEGDGFTFGGTVTAHYSDSSTANVTTSAEFSGYDLTQTGSQTVTVSYETKTTTYSITVNAGTLSSLGVYGYTSSYLKNSVFSFDGTCVATFTNDYDKEVTPTTVSSPNMSTSGTKTVTLSYTYNGKTVSCTYDIEVTNYRSVYEQQLIELGTIDYTGGSEDISVSTLSTGNTSGYSQIDGTAYRLGSGSYAGTVCVISTTSNIYKITVNAKIYGSDSNVTLSIAGTSNTLTSSYADYSKEFATPVSSVEFATSAKSKRAFISSFTVYTYGSVNIGSTSDCTGLETFISEKMHMDYTSNLGYCKDNEHHYYSTAKSAFNSLNDHQRLLFTTNSAYSAEWARLSAWATINGDSLNASNKLASIGSKQPSLIASGDNTSVIIVVVSLISITGLGAFLFIKHKKEE